jgi:sporulation protein YlmC with PRC-barrel domain
MHHSLVPSDRVEHATIYGRDGTELGTIERLMLDKVSGTVAYAVIKTGGLLGSHHHYPVPWTALRYDTRADAGRSAQRPVRVRRRRLRLGRPLAILPAPAVLDCLERFSSESLPALG